MLAVAGGKGGCGKTTTALGVARALARAGGRPLVVDADTDMPDLARRADAPVRPALTAETTIARGTHASPSLRGVCVATLRSEGSLAGALDRARGWEGCVLVDTGPGVTRPVAAALREADRALVVTTDTAESVEDAIKTAAVARELDAPPAGAVVRGTERRRVDGVLAVTPTERLPTVGEPLASRRCERAYRRLTASLFRTGRVPGGSGGSASGRQPVGSRNV